MPVNVVMPHMGESVVEGTIISWLKRPGDEVQEDEPLVEVETEKINVEIPSPAAGTLLKVLAEEGDTVPVEETIAVIGKPGEAPAQTAPQERPAEPAAKEPTPVPKPPAGIKAPEAAEAVGPAEEEVSEAAPAEVSGPVEEKPAMTAEEAGEPEEEAAEVTAAPKPGALGVLASPAVRRLARKLGVDLAEVRGSGRMGRITKEDVSALAEEGPPEPEAPEGAPATPGEDEELMPLTPMRRAIAEHMVRSKREAPHVTTVAEADMTAVAGLRTEWRERYDEAGVKLTYMAFILSAVARALKDYPELNASWSKDGVILKYGIHLGIAVAVSEGLVVPVIRDADRLSVAELASAVQAIAEKTRKGKISASEVAGGTFTITNPGVFGAVISTPIIHQPQSAILATGRIADVPAVVDGGLCVRKRMFLSLSYDHRVVDGATAVQFLQSVRKMLEEAPFDCSLGDGEDDQR